jgi:hypothetical protein
MGFGEDIAALGQQFQQAASQLAVQRAVAGATDQVNQIKAGEGDEIQKQAQLRQVSEGLTRDLAQFGAPADRIAMIANSISKPVPMYQSAQEALVNEKPGTDKYKSAQTYVKQEHDFKLQEATIKAKLGQQDAKRFDKMADDLNPMNTKIYGKLGTNVTRAEDLSGMIWDKSGKAQNLTAPNLVEVGLGYAQMINQGQRVPFELVKDIVPTNRSQNWADLASWFKEEPQAVDRQAFVARLGNSIERQRQIALHQIRDKQASVAYGKYGDLSEDPKHPLIAKRYGLNPAFVSSDGTYAPPSGYAEPNPYGSQAGGIPSPVQSPGGSVGGSPLTTTSDPNAGLPLGVSRSR